MTLARALIYGDKQHPELEGVAFFNQGDAGVWVMVDISGLPTEEDPCGGNFFGLHLHEGESCSGTDAEPFADAGGHYNPAGCRHPHHAGDMPPLLESDGDAYLSFQTSRFTVDEVVGKVIVIHGGADDFVSQPSGNAGSMIACGIIEEV